MGNVDTAGKRQTDLRTRYEDDGFAGPFGLGSPGQMSFVGLSLTRSVFCTPGPAPDDPYVNRHLDSPMVAQLCTHPAIRAQAEALLGPDLVVWRSLFFVKGPHGKDVMWHQDGHFWNLEPPVTITAWLAIERSHSADHCLEVIPGSHKSLLKHVAAPPGSQFPEAAEPDQEAVAKAIELPVDAGDFVLFDQNLVHRSRPGGTRRRLALSIRIAPRTVKIDPRLLPAGARVLPLLADAREAPPYLRDDVPRAVRQPG